jgi:putative DNA primase/helicase
MTIDLRTGAQYPPRREDYCTKSAGTKMKEMPTPLWSAFLDRVTNHDRDLQSYLQRVAGYCLTGDTREHALFFQYGTGANGKGTFVNTLAGVWGDYATTVPTEVLMESRGDRHPTELARLQGIRLAIANETEQGRRWAESRIKTLTGGDRVTARFMRQDFFEYIPQFKLMINGNHKPSLRGVDEAIRRRMHLIPFTVTIPENERDKKLPEKMKAEWPGILAWAVHGCRNWQAHGLQPPAAVLAATKAYLDTQDAFAAWLEECCEQSPDAWTPRSNLFKSWSDWATANGEFVGNRTRFLDALNTRGFEEATRRGYPGFRRLDLKPPAMPTDPYWNR